MAEQRYLYDIDDFPPIRLGLLYGFQWAVIMFPALIVVSNLSCQALQTDLSGSIRFFQLVLLISGLQTCCQCLWGHRYPILEGPSTALLLTFVTLAPYGIQTIQGGTIAGSAILVLLVASGRLDRAIAWATPNVVGVILMLIAFTLLPHLLRSLIGVSPVEPHGNGTVFLLSLLLVTATAGLSHWLRGFLKTVALLVGIVLGTFAFFVLQRLEIQGILHAEWFRMPLLWTPVAPSVYWPALLAFASAYIAVVVNSLGSLHGVARITDGARLPEAISRGILINGLGGICCGLLGLVGTVSYSMSPGVILANRVASRYAVVWCGIIIMAAAFLPKLAAVLSMIPSPVVGAALCTAMGAQVGAGLAVVAAGGPSVRDYFVVGLPLLIGTMVGFLPEPFMALMPTSLRVFCGNGLIVGIVMVLALEHGVLRKQGAAGSA
ncbi:MAG: uracil-xanthine permease family protein [Syntrophobacteraceae bacterium]